MKKDYQKIILEYGSDIINHKNYLRQKEYIQHGKTSVYEHEQNVTLYALNLADKLKWKVDTPSLVRGSLLHDYFLYDWHIPDKTHRLHGFSHPKKAYLNASKDFNLNKKEKNMILSHMFPLVLRPPRYKESIILTIADKIVASKETIKRK